MQNLDLKNKTVFITGVAGFIGSNLAERLLKEIEGIIIVGLDLSLIHISEPTRH